MKAPRTWYVGDARIRDLLARYACPTAFHVARTRFLGNVATPRLDASPIEAVKDLWDGEIPELEDVDALNALFQGLMSLWNHLAGHQSRSRPFRLVRAAAAPTRDGLRGLCKTRTDEIEGFVEGLFGGEERVDLPERAAEGMDHLAEINAMLHGVLDLLDDPDRTTTRQDLEETVRAVRELTRIAETEIHAVVLACVDARRLSLEPSNAPPPTIH